MAMDVEKRSVKSELEERLAYLEQIIREEQRMTRWELKSVRFAAFILLLFALIAIVAWGLYELTGLIIHLFTSLAHSLGL